MRRECKRRPLKWAPERQEAFDALKNALAQAPLLACPDCSKEFILATDASIEGAGAVIYQMQSEEMRSIACASHKFANAQQRWAIPEKELYAFAHAAQVFNSCLYGAHFLWKTDAKALKWLQTASRASKLTRWALALQDLDFTIERMPGKDNVMPDALSRQRAATLLIEPASPYLRADGAIYNLRPNFCLELECNCHYCHKKSQNSMQKETTKKINRDRESDRARRASDASLLPRIHDASQGEERAGASASELRKARSHRDIIGLRRRDISAPVSACATSDASSEKEFAPTGADATDSTRAQGAESSAKRYIEECQRDAQGAKGDAKRHDRECGRDCPSDRHDTTAEKSTDFENDAKRIRSATAICPGCRPACARSPSIDDAIKRQDSAGASDSRISSTALLSTTGHRRAHPASEIKGIRGAPLQHGRRLLQDAADSAHGSAMQRSRQDRFSQRIAMPLMHAPSKSELALAQRADPFAGPLNARY